MNNISNMPSPINPINMVNNIKDDMNVNSPFNVGPALTAGKYYLYNNGSGKFLQVRDPISTNLSGVDLNIEPSLFEVYIVARPQFPGKYLIKLVGDYINQNGTNGWHLYTLPLSAALFGSGNDGLWATFYIDNDPSTSNYIIRSFHSKTINDRLIYVDNLPSIKSDGITAQLQTTSKNNLWNFFPYNDLLQNPIKYITKLEDTFSCKLYNVNSKKYLYANEPTPNSNRCLKMHDEGSQFVIQKYGAGFNKYIIKLEALNINQNNTEGWHLYTRPMQPNLFGAGNKSIWSAFDLIKRGPYYFIQSNLNDVTQQNTYVTVETDDTPSTTPLLSIIKTNGDVSLNANNCLWLFVV